MERGGRTTPNRKGDPHRGGFPWGGRVPPKPLFVCTKIRSYVRIFVRYPEFLFAFKVVIHCIALLLLQWYDVGNKTIGGRNMSNIKELIKLRINELALLELQEAEDEARTPEMIGISLRMPSDTVSKLDLVAKKLKMTRSEIIRTLLEAGVNEALKELNVDYEEVIEATSKKGDDLNG